MVLYHGTTKNKLAPDVNSSDAKPNNDFGKGFYLTDDISLAKEWSGSLMVTESYVHKYNFSTVGLKVLDLTKADDLVPWLYLLVKNRKPDFNHSDISRAIYQMILDSPIKDLDSYDVIIGYRADDAYYAYLRDFIQNTISVETIIDAMKYGDLGVQYFLKTNKAIANLSFVQIIPVNAKHFYAKKNSRTSQAKDKYVHKNKTYQSFTSPLEYMKGKINGK